MPRAKSRVTTSRGHRSARASTTGGAGTAHEPTTVIQELTALRMEPLPPGTSRSTLPGSDTSVPEDNHEKASCPGSPGRDAQQATATWQEGPSRPSEAIYQRVNRAYSDTPNDQVRTEIDWRGQDRIEIETVRVYVKKSFLHLQSEPSHQAAPRGCCSASVSPRAHAPEPELRFAYSKPSQGRPIEQRSHRTGAHADTGALTHEAMEQSLTDWHASRHMPTATSAHEPVQTAASATSTLPA